MRNIKFLIDRYKLIKRSNDFSLHPKRFFFYRNNFAFFRKTPKNKFFIYGQGRSGSSLLVSLLNSHPDIFCDGEIFGMPSMGKMLFPFFYIKHASKKRNLQNFTYYGFKMKTYQLTEYQMIHDERFLIKKLIENGWKMIYLKRENILKHAFSSIMAEKHKAWKIENNIEIPKIYVDIENLVNIINWRKKHFEQERNVIADLSYITVFYEKDLLNKENQQKVCNEIFDYLDVSRVNVKTSLKKMTKSSFIDNIENYDEFFNYFVKTQYKNMII